MNVSILHCKANMMLEATAVSLFPLLSHDRSSLAETMPMIGMEGAVTYTRLFYARDYLTSGIDCIIFPLLWNKRMSFPATTVTFK